MANILVNIEKGIEIGAEDALKWLVSAGKAFHAAPAAIAALEKTIVEIRKYPGSENPNLHPTDEDLSVGTPDPGHPDETTY